MSEVIDSFDGDYAFLSNFAAFPVTVQCIYYQTVEHAYQSRKCVSIRDLRTIMDCDTPGQAKRMGGQVEMHPDFEADKVAIMTEIVSAKFRDNPLLYSALLATGEKYLIEGNRWHDNFWGHCNCDACFYKYHSGNAAMSDNHLGRILMDLRTKLREEATDED